MSNVLTALEKKKLILRGKSTDTSSYNISLTAHGSLMVIQAHTAVQKFEHHLFNKKALSVIEKHFDELMKDQEDVVDSQSDVLQVIE